MILIQMKLQVPQRRPEVLRRQRLLDFFAQYQHHKLLLLCAPAGYGKSTLLIDYASDTHNSICWYSLDESDRNPIVFLRYLTESIRLRFPDFGTHTLQMLETVAGEERDNLSEQHLDAQLSEVIEVLLNELYETVTSRFSIVLNDYHNVDNTSINALMKKLLRYLPENGQLILLSREIPALALPQMVAQQEIAGLGTAELRFTMEETATFLRQHCGREFPDQEIEALVQRFDGWITGIILSTALTKQFVSRLNGSDNMTQIFNYLAMEVLEQQHEDVQRFLLETSLLPRLSVPLCNALLGYQNAQKILYQITAKGLFLEAIGSEKAERTLEKLYASDGASAGENGGNREQITWYSYHNLFRAFLYQHLQTQNPDLFRTLHQRAADLFLAEDNLEEAIPYLLSIQDYERAAQIIAEEQQRFVEVEQLALCEQWLDTLPCECIEHYPGLLFVRTRALCRFGRSSEALEQAQRAEILYKTRQDIMGQVEALLEQCSVLYWLGRHSEMISICHHAQELLSHPYTTHLTTDQNSQLELLRAKIFRQLGVAFLHCGEARMALARFTHALTIYLDLKQSTEVAQVHENLALVLMALAEDKGAEDHLQQVIQLFSSKSTHKIPKFVLMAYNNLAVLYGYQGRYQLALETLHEAQNLLQQSGDTRAQAYLAATHAEILSNMGQGIQAEAIYAEAWAIIEQAHDTYLSFWLAQGQAENHIWRGELEQAQKQIHKMRSFLPQEERGHAWGLFYLTCSHIARYASNFLEALQNTQRALELFRACQWRRAEIQATVCIIGLLWKLKSPHEAISILDTLLEQVDPASVSPSIQRIFFCEERELVSVLLDYCKRPEASEQQYTRARWLLHQLQKQERNPEETLAPCQHEHSSAPAVHTHAQLQILALGEPRVYLGDTLITQWRSAKARELLFYFVASSTPQRKEVVIEALWPEAMLPQADWLFRSTLHRLRQAIGQDCIVYQHGLYSLNLSCWYDVQEFRDTLTAAQQLEIHDSQKHANLSDQLLTTYRNAINLYGGDYCEPFYADWCRPWREELRQHYIGALIRLAQLSWECGLLDESATLWRRLLSIDECSEEAHQGLMTYYAASRQRVMVARQYQRCQEALEEFGMLPSPETLAVYQHATSSENRIAAI